MPTPFSTLFSRLRREAGFQTAYRFYHGNGGRRVLQCTFPNYLRIERGETLPRPGRLPLLSNLLRLPLGRRELAPLVRAYLETWSGSADTVDWLRNALASPAGGEAPPDPARQALHRVVRQSARPVGMRQYRAIVRDRASYWCYRVLASSSKGHGAAELSRLLGFPEPELRGALESLRRAGFLRRGRDGLHRCPEAGNFLLFPDPSVLPASLIERVRGFNRDMARRKGELLMTRHCGTRVDLDRFEGFLPYFREAVRTAQAYSVSEPSPRSALVLVEGRVYKLLDF